MLPLLLILACGQPPEPAASTSTSSPGWKVASTPAEPQPAPTPKTPTAADKGLADANAHIDRGVLQIISFGELPPPDYLDRETGLPVGSEGCEIDADQQPYIDAYNQRMREYIKDSPPFPDDLVVTHTVRGSMHTGRTEVTRTSVRRYATREVHEKGNMRLEGFWTPADSLTAQRLKVGVLAQRAASVKVPASRSDGKSVESLQVVRGDQTWSISWRTGEQPPAKVAAAVAAIAELKER